MAKTGKVKKKTTANPKSRASKRATSPSIDVDKSLRDAPRASDATPVLSARHDGGVTKPKRKQKPLTKGQRRRLEHSLARAEAVQDQRAKKVDGATSRLKKRKDRAGIWEEINGNAQFDKMKSVLAQTTDEKGGGDEWVDEAMEEVEDSSRVDTKIVQGTQLPAIAAGTTLVVVDRTAPSSTTDMDDEVTKIT